MTGSTLVMSGSVNSRNFVPVSVWKQVRRNLSDSRTSRPVTGVPGMGSAWVVVVEVQGPVGVDGVVFVDVETEGVDLWVVRIEEVEGWWWWPPPVRVLGWEEEVVVVERGILGVMLRVIAWTLFDLFC